MMQSVQGKGEGIKKKKKKKALKTFGLQRLVYFPKSIELGRRWAGKAVGGIAQRCRRLEGHLPAQRGPSLSCSVLGSGNPATVERGVVVGD